MKAAIDTRGRSDPDPEEHHVNGLTSEEASRRLAASGPNVLYTAPPLRFFSILFEEIREPMILLLLFVGVVYSLTGKPEDALTIFVVIVLLVLAEVWNEFRAKKAIAALTEISAPRARVRRDGAAVEIASAEVVPGDVLLLTAGTRIAADATLLRVTGLQVDESALTGESFPVSGETGGAVSAGTVVVAGDAEAEVTETGARTRLGRVAGSVAQVRPPRTPLQLAMRSLAGKLVWVAVGFSVLIPVIGLLRGQDLRTMFLTGLSLSFATIPEELPIIITMVLGLGSLRLARSNFLVKRLAAAETLGSTTVIVTDKTGTITASRMTVAATFPASEAARVLSLALGTIVDYAPTTSPVELALQDEAARSGATPPANEIVRLRDIGDGGKTKAAVRGGTLYVSGAPEEVFAACIDVPEDARTELATQSALGRRVIGVATRQVPAGARNAAWGDLERDMSFAGLIAFDDPPRPGVADTIRSVAGAGIRTVMVTGDHPATASAIAAEVGIAGTGAEVLTGADLATLDDAGLRDALGRVSVFARTTPQDKYRIVRALQERGDVVAVTGDGINDAIALRGADIGIAMGIRGTDVAKEAAAAVLADDDYNTIAQAVLEGRTFFDNLRKGVKYYLSVKVALVAVFLLPVIVGLPLPFSPIQIIVLELFMDLAASAGFVAEKAEGDVLLARPRPKSAALFDRTQVIDLFVKGAFLFVAVTAVYLWARAIGLPFEVQRTLAFAAWIVGHVALAVESRSDRQPLWKLGVLSNRVIDAWAVAAVALLVVAIYVPAVGMGLNLVEVPVATLAGVAVAVIAWIALLEVWKAARRT
jgi:P-type Ca2+ transporter type 2C